MSLQDLMVLVNPKEAGFRSLAMMLALRAGVQLVRSGRTVILVEDGREQVLCTPTRSYCMWKETWAAMRKRFPLLTGF